jgi:hypothetical protein
MASAKSTQRSKRIEAQTHKVLTIETTPTTENIAKCNQQLQYPLFKKLPAESRKVIFSLALLQYEDLANPYPEHDFCYRPAHRARRIVSTDLLLTCRRIWLEANHWPMEQAVHSFWFDTDRRPTWTKNFVSAHTSSMFPAIDNDDSRFTCFVKSLTPLQKSRIRHIQIFAQMYWLEDFLCFSSLWHPSSLGVPALSSFTITIRHSDWDLWEEGEPLGLNLKCVSGLLRSNVGGPVSEFRLELETFESHVDQLRPILESLKSATEPSEDDTVRWELTAPFGESSWSGPTNLGGEEREIYSQRDKLNYRITTMEWRRREPAAEKLEQRWREEGSLLKLLGTDVEPEEVEYAARSRYQPRYEYRDSEDSDDDGEGDDEDGDGDSGDNNDTESVDHNEEDHDAHRDDQDLEAHHEGLREGSAADQHEDIQVHDTHRAHSHDDREDDDE